jgi:hypothetical protein
MRRSRINYWTCSKFADMIRGEKKPASLTLDGWNSWRKNLQKKKPFRYYLSEKFLGQLQNFLYYPSDVIYNIKCYIRNRFITQTHNLKSDLKKGQWYDLDTRILHSLFNELVEFVEIELSHLSKWDSNKKYKFKNGRCIEAAYDYFEWACNLSDEYSQQQKEDSIKIKELYEWWTKERPNRIDPLMTITKETHGKYYFRLINDIEQDYTNEDTAKLIELIKIRGSLWT